MPTRRGLALAVLAGMCSGHAVAQEPAPARPATSDAPAPLTEREKVAHLLRRFTLGASRELFDRVCAEGWRPWLTRQLIERPAPPPALARRLEPLATLRMDLAALFDAYGDAPPDDATADAGRRADTPRREALAGALLRAVYDDANPVRQVAADFLRNHFSVDVGKGDLRLFVVTWERDVIQRHALGRFGELLAATARHPAMLCFLDNHLSRRPATEQELREIERRSRRAGRAEVARQRELALQRGLNENYARELLELHTLGVDNGYRQADVIAVAQCLTGWTIGDADQFARHPSGFRFDPEMHVPGDKPFLGGRIRGNWLDPEAEGQQVLDHLTAHAGTALFLAGKLCRWLVHDEPNPLLVKRIAAAYLRTQGDLRAVLLAIADDPAFFARANVGTKFKRPFEFVVSALRVTGADVQDVAALQQALADMDEPLYRCPDPTGYYDQAESWRDPGALAPRWSFAAALVHDRLPGVRVPGALFAGLPPAAPESWVTMLAERLLPGGTLSAHTAARLQAIAAGRGASGGPDDVARVARTLAAGLLGSPEFQRQ